VLPRAQGAGFREADQISRRVKRLHLRAHRYGLRALEVTHPGFAAQLERDPAVAVQTLAAEDIEPLYWTGASLAAAIAIGADDMQLVAKLPRVDALMRRAFALQPDWAEGTLHEFFISYEGRGEALGGSPARAREHFDRAVALAHGQRVAPYVALAEAVAIKQQDRALFDQLITQALGVDADQAPRHRLANLIAQDRARWLHDHVDDYFLGDEIGAEEPVE